MKSVQFIFLSFFSLYVCYSQDGNEKPPVKVEHKKLKYFLSGDVFTGFRFRNEDEQDEKFNISNTGITPILILKLSEKLIYEGELAVLFSGEDGFKKQNEPEVAVEYSNFGYIVNDYVIIRAGTFYSTTGVFEDWHQQFITNKMNSKPLGIGRLGNESSTDLGVNLRGLIPIKRSKLNYSMFITNGEMLNMNTSLADTVQPEPDKFNYSRFKGNDFNKAISVRIGYLPFGNSSLELGISGQWSEGHDEKSIYESTNNYFGGCDMTYLKDIDAIRGSVHLWSAFYFLHSLQEELKKSINYDHRELYSENSISEAGFLQFSYRPTEILNKFFRKCEIALRYSLVEFPQANDFRIDLSQMAVALDYWVHWNSVIKISYEEYVFPSNHKSGQFITTFAYVF